MHYYRILNPDTDMYSNGGVNPPSFTLEGKVWRGKQNLERHLTLVKRNGHLDQYQGCEVVRYELKPITSIPLEHFNKLGG